MRNLGFAGWIDQQISLSPSLLTEAGFQQAIDSRDDNNLGPIAQQYFAWANLAVESIDQLRHRMAWALSQIIVINNDEDGTGTIGSRNYYNFYLQHALGNYRDLLADVTFSYPMGVYLTYVNNARANPEAGTEPDENYAREVMQLFSVGLFDLNLDGTHKLDAQGNSIPTYSNDDITQFARVFTGLRVSTIGANFQESAGEPMRMDVTRHEFGSKQLLTYPGAVNNGFIPARSETEANGISDIHFAIDNVFNHPNTAPFVCRQLIQRLVTSNPTPAYVGRVAAVFEDDGNGVRGNLGAVAKAILLDPEARDPVYMATH